MSRLRGLYVITPTDLATRAGLLSAVEQTLRGGARIVQYRDKSGDPVRRLDRASALRTLCRRFDVPLIVNDDPGLAARVRADGVHLGREDADPAAARAALGPHALVGVSCYDDYARAVRARAAGADYVAFGSFHPSPTKPQAVRADPRLLRRARRELGLPVVAIGGITPENGRALIDAGADMLAVISAVFDQPDIAAAARAFASLFPEEPSP
jgi:thiamine-phosphate pyrophosphorylase